MAKVDKRRNQVKEVEPLFPRYIFAQLRPGRDDFHPIIRTTGVVAIVRFGLWLATVPDSLISELRKHEDAQGVHAIPKHDYAPGDTIKIRSGVFQGYEAIVQAKKHDRIIVLFDLATQEARLELEYKDVEPMSA
jgi:transcriptional antiterminator RfaH